MERVRKELRISQVPLPNLNVEESMPIFHRGRFNLGPPYRMPPADGPVIVAVEKVPIPMDQFPEYNFIGRLVGPRGRTIKQIEYQTGCQVFRRLFVLMLCY